MERKLAAILAADVAGYSRLMGADEEGTLAALRAHREVVDGLISAHRGRVFNTAGDSVIAEFPSAVEATLCAVAIQQELAQRSAAVPKDKRLEFRIGINIGDVMVDGANLFGDGVNVADRVQKLAEPGGICVARNVHDHLRNKAELAFEPMGEHQVKNISVPVSVYRVLAPGTARRPLHQRWAAAVRRHRRIAAVAAVLLIIAIGGLAAWSLLTSPGPRGFPRLAVLPFQDLTDGAAPAHYGEGVSEDLITLLSRFPDLTVLSRNASFAYKGPEISIVSSDKSFTLNGKDIDPVEVGRALKVDYVIEGSVQKKDDGLRITARLIDTQTNLQVWAEGYDGAIPSSLQDEAVGKIVVALSSEEGEIRNHEYERTKGVATADLDEYGLYLRSHEMLMRAKSIEEHDRIAPLLQQGLERLPDSALLKVALARYYFARPSDFNTDNPDADNKRAGELAQEAIASPNPSPSVRWIGYRLTAYTNWFKGDFVRAVADAEATVALAPYDANTLSRMSRIQIAAGNVSRGIEWVQESMRRDPTIARNTRILAWAYYLTGEYDKSVEAARKHEELSRGFAEDALWYMTASYVRLGRLEEARAALGELLKMAPGWTLTAAREFQLRQPYKNSSVGEQELVDVAAAGLPELPSGYDAKAQDRLTTDEIKTLLFGHTISGRELKTGKALVDVITADGAISETDDAVKSTATLSYVRNNVICYSWSRWGPACGAIFRNPDGVPEQQDEYIWITAWTEFRFSVEK